MPHALQRVLDVLGRELPVIAAPLNARLQLEADVQIVHLLDRLDDQPRLPGPLVAGRVVGELTQAGVLQLDLDVADHEPGIEHLEVALHAHLQDPAILGQAHSRKRRRAGRRYRELQHHAPRQVPIAHGGLPWFPIIAVAREPHRRRRLAGPNTRPARCYATGSSSLMPSPRALGGDPADQTSRPE